MTKVIQIKDVDVYAQNIEEMTQIEEDIEKLEAGRDDVLCDITILLNFHAHSKFNDEQIYINHTLIQEAVCDYIRKILIDRNKQLEKQNEELEVEVDLDGK